MIDAKVWVWLAVALAIIGGAGYAGIQVGQWQGRAESAQNARDDATTILRLTSENTGLKLGIAAQNSAVAVAQAQADSAEQARAMAEQHARDLAVLSESRMSKIDKALKEAKTVGEVLSRYWEIRQ